MSCHSPTLPQRPVILLVRSPSWMAAVRQQLPPGASPRWVSSWTSATAELDACPAAPLVVELASADWGAAREWLLQRQRRGLPGLVIGLGPALAERSRRRILQEAGLAAGLAGPAEADRLGHWLKRCLVLTPWPEVSLEQEFRERLPWPDFAESTAS